MVGPVVVGLVQVDIPLRARGQEGGGLEPLGPALGPGALGLEGGLLEPLDHPPLDAPQRLLGFGGLGVPVPEVLEHAKAPREVAQDVEGLGGLELRGDGRGGVRVHAHGLGEGLEGPGPVALELAGQAHAEPGLLHEGMVREQVHQAIEVGQGLLDVGGGMAALGPEPAQQKEGVPGLGVLEVPVLKLLEEGEGGVGLVLHIQLVPGQAQQGPRGEGGLGELGDELVPGLGGFGVAVGGMGALTGTVEPFGHVAVLGAQQGRGGQDQGHGADPGS